MRPMTRVLCFFFAFFILCGAAPAGAQTVDPGSLHFGASVEEARRLFSIGQAARLTKASGDVSYLYQGARQGAVRGKQYLFNRGRLYMVIFFLKDYDPAYYQGLLAFFPREYRADGIATTSSEAYRLGDVEVIHQYEDTTYSHIQGKYTIVVRHYTRRIRLDGADRLDEDTMRVMYLSSPGPEAPVTSRDPGGSS